jgi:hypothetical protein
MLLGDLHALKPNPEGEHHRSPANVRITFSGGHLDFSPEQDCSRDEGGMVFVLPIISSPWEMTRSNIDRNGPAIIHGNSFQEINMEKQNAIVQIQGLLLKPTNFSKGEYQRVGYFKILSLGKGTNWFKAVEELGTETARSGCAEILTNPQFPDENYVINII